MIELHYFSGNASMAPHIVLHELALPFVLRLVDRERNAHKDPAYLALNPNGLIPALRDGELVLFESAAICLYLADKAPGGPAGQQGPTGTPDPGLLPPLGSADRAQAYKWLFWLSNSLQATLIHYFYPERLVDVGNTAGAAQVKAHAQARVGELLDLIEAQFAGHAQPWLLGARYSVADPFAFMLCRWTRGFEGTPAAPARTRPTLRAWLDRMLARPAVQRVLADEGLAAPWV